MRNTPACTLFHLLSCRNPTLCRYSHTLAPNKESTPSKNKATVTPKRDDASRKLSDEKQGLTPRQIKRNKYWNNATQKSQKDRLAYEQKRKSTENGISVAKPSLSATDISEHLTWKLFKKRKSIEDRAQVNLPTKESPKDATEKRVLFKHERDQKLQSKQVRVRRVQAVDQYRKIKVSPLTDSSNLQRLRIRKQKSSRVRLYQSQGLRIRRYVDQHRRTKVAQTSKSLTVEEQRKLRAQRYWLSRKIVEFRRRTVDSRLQRVRNRDLRSPDICLYRAPTKSKSKQTSFKLRKQKSVRARRLKGLVASRTFGPVRQKTDNLSEPKIDTATENHRWSPFMQRRKHRLASLQAALDELASSLNDTQQESNLDVVESKAQELVQEEKPRASTYSGGTLKDVSSPINPNMTGSPILRQLSSRSNAQQRSFSGISSSSFHSSGLQINIVLKAQRATFATSSRDFIHDSKASSLPVSPLEKKFEQSRQRQTKRQPTSPEYEELANNPWAVMLSGSIRQDNASRVRVPTDLLIDFAGVTSPVNDLVYQMPTDLADLEAFANRLKSSKKKFTKARSTNDKKGNRTRISPYRLLVDEISDSVQVWDQEKGVSRAKTAAVMRRMVPPRWITETEKQETYQNASKDYWTVRKARGEADDGVFEKPEAPFDLRQLQWQTAIADRMLNMMSQRILIALDHIGNMRKARVPFSPSQKSSYDWPDDLWLELDGMHPSEPKAEFWNDMGDIEAGGAIDGTSSRQGNAEDPRPPIAMTPAEISESSPSQAVASATIPDWLPGSFFLHLGPATTALRALPYVDQSLGSDQILSTNFRESKYITPMITVGQGYRLPVFNLSAMLAPDFAETLEKLLARHKDVFLDGLDTKESYLVLFRADVKPYKYGGQITLAHELWQLWRYLGGRDCLLAPKVQADDMGTIEHIPKSVQVRRTKNVSEYSGLSTAAWKHFYELLDLRPKGSWGTAHPADAVSIPDTNGTKL